MLAYKNNHETLFPIYDGMDLFACLLVSVIYVHRHLLLVVKISVSIESPSVIFCSYVIFPYFVGLLDDCPIDLSSFG